MSDETSVDLDDRDGMPSLCDPAVAGDVLEAFVDAEDREGGGLAFLFCDAEGRLLQPVLVGDLPEPMTPEHRQHAMRWATELCAVVSNDGGGPLGLVCAVVRESGPVSVEDWEWHEAAIAACQEAAVRLIGMHLVTVDGVVALPPVTRAA